MSLISMRWLWIFGGCNNFGFENHIFADIVKDVYLHAKPIRRRAVLLLFTRRGGEYAGQEQEDKLSERLGLLLK